VRGGRKKRCGQLVTHLTLAAPATIAEILTATRLSMAFEDKQAVSDIDLDERMREERMKNVFGVQRWWL
jgi:hypothetical protein